MGAGDQMTPELVWNNTGPPGVRAMCDRCRAPVTFEPGYGGSWWGAHGPHYSEGTTRLPYTIWRLLKCSVCNRGAIVELGGIRDGEREMLLVSFLPIAIQSLALPGETPEAIRQEFLEAERCAAAGAFRGASAMLRSALEKTLRANGYTAGSLAKKIDDAAGDGTITRARMQRAHDEVRVLGNEVVHDPWRPVDHAEFDLAHFYTQRVIEDFYEHRDEVLKVLAEAKRQVPAEAPGTATEQGVESPEAGPPSAQP